MKMIPLDEVRNWLACILLLFSVSSTVVSQTAPEDNDHELHVTEAETNGKKYSINHQLEGTKTGPHFTTVSKKGGLEVFGWYPYWEEDKYNQLEYKLLSTIAYFAYQLNPATGEADKLHDWSSTLMVDSAEANHVDLLLTVQNFGAQNNTQFLNSLSARKVLIDNLVNLVKSRSAQGVCLNFEGLVGTSKDSLTSFVKDLHEEFANQKKGWRIYLTLPKSDGNKAYDFKGLSPNVYKYVITGYSYHSKGTSHAGPVSPLEGGAYNLKKTVTYYKQYIDPADLILGLPAYGMIWETATSDPKGAVTKYIGARTFDYIEHKIKTPENFDTVAKSAWKTIKMDTVGSVYRQCWYESEKSIEYKLSYIEEEELGGVAIWALGFNTGAKDVWAKLQAVVTDSSTSEDEGGDSAGGGDSKTPVLNKSTWKALIKKLQPVEKVLEPVVSIKSVVSILLVIILIFSGLGILAAMFFPDTRQFFFNTSVRKLTFLWFVFFTLVMLLRIQDWLSNSALLVLVSFLIGAFAMNMINKYINKIKRDLP